MDLAPEIIQLFFFNWLPRWDFADIIVKNDIKFSPNIGQLVNWSIGVTPRVVTGDDKFAPRH